MAGNSEKQIADLEKRVKALEGKVKSLADTATDPKQIKGVMDAIKAQEDKSDKDKKRLEELGKKHAEAEAAKVKKENDKYVEKVNKEAEKMSKEMATKAELAQLRALVMSALAK